MGHFDNETELHIFSDEIMQANWLLSEETGLLHIVPLKNQSFEMLGPDDEDSEILLSKQIQDNEFNDEEFMLDLGFYPVQDSLKRFSKTDGYFTA